VPGSAPTGLATDGLPPPPPGRSTLGCGSADRRRPGDLPVAHPPAGLRGLRGVRRRHDDALAAERALAAMESAASTGPSSAGSRWAGTWRSRCGDALASASPG
jgi:hypothetical protein